MGGVCSTPATGADVPVVDDIKTSEEEAQRKAEEEARIKAEEEAAQKKAEEEAAKAEEERKAAEAAAEKQRLEEEEAAKKAAEEEAARKAEEEAKAAAEAAEKAAKEAAEKKAAEEAAKKKAAEDKKKKDALNKKLIAACKKDRVTEVKTLLGQGASIECKAADGRTPLLLAVEGVPQEGMPAGMGANPSNGELVNLLLSKKANIKATGKDGKSVMKIVADTCAPSEKVTLALLKAGAKLTATELKEVTMTFASTIRLFKGKKDACPSETIKAWVQMGVDVEAKKDPSASETPLVFAIRSGRTELVQLLLEKGANMKVKLYATGDSPLNVAATRDREKITTPQEDIAVCKTLIDWAASDKNPNKFSIEEEDKEGWDLAQKVLASKPGLKR